MARLQNKKDVRTGKRAAELCGDYAGFPPCRMFNCGGKPAHLCLFPRCAAWLFGVAVHRKKSAELRGGYMPINYVLLVSVEVQTMSVC